MDNFSETAAETREKIETDIGVDVSSSLISLELDLFF